MRIAFLTYRFPVISETFILRQVTGLLDAGHDVRVFAEFLDDPSDEHPAVELYGLRRRTQYLNLPPASGIYEMSVWPLFGSAWPGGERVSNAGRLMRCIPKAMKCFAAHPGLTQQVLSTRDYGYQAASLSALYRLSALSTERPKFDVLHAHFGPVGKSFRFARRLWRAPLIVSFHGYDFSMWPLREGPSTYETLFEEADLITVHSDYAAGRLRALGCPQHLLRRLECGLDLDEFSFRSRHPSAGAPVRLLTVGRLIEKKGVEFSIRAVAQLLREGYDLQYEIIGDGPLRAPLSRLANELAVAEKVNFAGAKDIGYVRNRMYESDLFVLASVTAANGDTEGAPVSLLEAQASGMPVVSTRHAGIPEIVRENQSGYLVPEADSPAIADALRRLLDKPALWPHMGQRGRVFVEERHDIHALNRRLMNIYEEAVAGNTASTVHH